MRIISFHLSLHYYFRHHLTVRSDIAAGDDFLNIMLVNWVFRHAGAFFMRRTFREDALYRSVFTEYVTRLVTGGYTLEFYLEGTRSRTGKNLTPKLGLLSMVTDTYFDGGVTDLCFVPMSLAYVSLHIYEKLLLKCIAPPCVFASAQHQ